VATGYGGGGVGIQGQGSNGTYVIGSYVYTYSGFGGSGGTNGIGKVGGTYGGGAGGESASYNFPPSGQAGQGGAVRILWGQGRHFPSTNTSTSYDKNLIVPTIPASPTYTLSRSASSVEERNSITITLTTTNTVDGTVIPYSITGINASDLSSGSTTGNFVITNNVGTITIAIAEDFTTEGTETATLELESPGIGSISWTINDSSITYALSRDKTTIAEEETITITLTTQGLPNGNTVPYTITGISSSDLTSGTLTGNFTINNNSATQTFTAVSDASTEGTETAVLTLDGLAQSISWTITDPFIIPNLYDATFFAGLRSVLSSNLSIFKNTGFYEYVLDGNSTFISDGANDMYDSGNYTQLFENGTQLVNPIDYSTATNTTSGNIRYASLGYARPLSVIAVTQQGVSRRFGFGKTGNLGADGGGTTDTLDMGGSYLSYSYSAWARRVYNAGDPSICDLYMTIYSPTKLNSSYGGVNISDYSTSTDNGYSRYETTSSNSIVIAMLLSKPSGSAVTSSEATTVIQNVISVINSYIG
jgi:hypothetical protein